MTLASMSKRGYFAIALLAASWLPGIGYFHLPDALAWSILVAAGILLLLPNKDDAASFVTASFVRPQKGARKGVGSLALEKTPDPFVPSRAPMGTAAILCAIAAIGLPWPYRAIPVLLACGAALLRCQSRCAGRGRWVLRALAPAWFCWLRRLCCLPIRSSRRGHMNFPRFSPRRSLRSRGVLASTPPTMARTSRWPRCA